MYLRTFVTPCDGQRAENFLHSKKPLLQHTKSGPRLVDTTLPGGLPAPQRGMGKRDRKMTHLFFQGGGQFKDPMGVVFSICGGGVVIVNFLRYSRISRDNRGGLTFQTLWVYGCQGLG